MLASWLASQKNIQTQLQTYYDQLGYRSLLISQSETSQSRNASGATETSFQNNLTNEKRCPYNELTPDYEKPWIRFTTVFFFVYMNNKTTFSFQILAGLSHLGVPCLRVRYVLLKPLYPKNCGVNVHWKDAFVSRQLLIPLSTIKPNYKITHALLSVAFPLSE